MLLLGRTYKFDKNPYRGTTTVIPGHGVCVDIEERIFETSTTQNRYSIKVEDIELVPLIPKVGTIIHMKPREGIEELMPRSTKTGPIGRGNLGILYDLDANNELVVSGCSMSGCIWENNYNFYIDPDWIIQPQLVKVDDMCETTEGHLVQVVAIEGTNAIIEQYGLTARIELAQLICVNDKLLWHVQAKGRTKIPVSYNEAVILATEHKGRLIPCIH